MQHTILDELKQRFSYGGIYIQLIYLNVGVFLLIHLLGLLSTLFQTPVFAELNQIVFVLPGSFLAVAMQPWTLITYMFAHVGFMHLLSNMLFLFFGGQLFQHLLGERKLLYTYVVGGLAGAIFQLFANTFVPFFQAQQSALVGASASIMAVLVAVGSYRPNYVVNLFGLLPVKLMYIVLFFVLSDFLNITSGDNVGHLAHLGGALFGFLSVRNVTSSSNWMNKIELWGDRVWTWVKQLFQPKKKFKVYKNTQYHSQARAKSDEDFLAEKKAKQERTDAILDKISKRGYDALTKEEKAFLFSQKDQ